MWVVVIYCKYEQNYIIGMTKYPIKIGHDDQINPFPEIVRNMFLQHRRSLVSTSLNLHFSVH
jgi:hypothetical protein